MKPTIYITPAGRAFFAPTLSSQHIETHTRPVSLAMPAWMARADDYTPTDGGASACVEHVQ